MTTEINQFNPFPGLRPFQREEDYLFFGREEQTMELLRRLRDSRFLAVVGTSGSGKSSLVPCGGSWTISRWSFCRMPTVHELRS